MAYARKVLSLYIHILIIIDDCALALQCGLNYLILCVGYHYIKAECEELEPAVPLEGGNHVHAFSSVSYLAMYSVCLLCVFSWVVWYMLTPMCWAFLLLPVYVGMQLLIRIACMTGRQHITSHVATEIHLSLSKIHQERQSKPTKSHPEGEQKRK